MSVDAQQFIEETNAPADEPIEQLDVRDLGPPKPLSKTLERLAEMDGGVLVQLNDRAPQHLYPKLADRGYRYETRKTDEMTVTVIWKD
jgi:TusA-related sulfurtransferase